MLATDRRARRSSVRTLPPLEAATCRAQDREARIGCQIGKQFRLAEIFGCRAWVRPPRARKRIVAGANAHSYQSSFPSCDMPGAANVGLNLGAEVCARRHATRKTRSVQIRG